MIFTINKNKSKEILKWLTENVGPQTNAGQLSIIKETIEVNGEPRLTFPIYRKGEKWKFKDISRDGLSSTLELDDDILSKDDAIIFTLKYL